MRKKTSKEFGCILTHEQEEFINDGRPRDNALKILEQRLMAMEEIRMARMSKEEQARREGMHML